MFGFVSSKTVSSRKRNSLLLYLFAFCLLSGASVRAQETGGSGDGGVVPANIAPPPLKIISKEEKEALAAVSDVKDRTKLSLDLMEARLKKAETLNTQESFNALLTELGTFQALMNDALNFLNRNDDRRGKIMNTFKRFEMALRAFMPRLELLRREMPDRFEYHVRKVLISVRDTRSKAVEPLFGSTVVPGGSN